MKRCAPLLRTISAPRLMLELGALVLAAPLLAGCHVEIEGDNIDLPPERPGRFLPEAAPAEARAAQEQERREDMARNNGQNPDKAQPTDRYEPLAPSDAATGPLQAGDGHSVIPETQAIYGKREQQQPSSAPQSH
ncbi:MAG: hypothetical protein ABF430_02225 [Acetobacter persici]